MSASRTWRPPRGDAVGRDDIGMPIAEGHYVPQLSLRGLHPCPGVIRDMKLLLLPFRAPRVPLPGLEPRLTDPETAVLPVTPQGNSRPAGLRGPTGVGS